VAANSASDGWPTPLSIARSSPASSPPPLDDKELPSFENSQFDEILQTPLDPLQIASHQYDFPDPSAGVSPTSSTGAEPDLDHADWGLSQFEDLQTMDSSTEWEAMSPRYSDSSNSEANPFADANTQKKDPDTEEIPTHESKSLDVDM
jgi:ubiquitin carboxyl-terminal hydrolase 4/11/15